MRITDAELIMRPGARIGGDLIAHHASLRIEGARIDGDVELFCTGGTIGNSRIAASIRVHKRALWHVRCDTTKRLVIGPGSEIGSLITEVAGVEVEVSGEARIGATIGQTVSPAATMR